MNPRAAVAACCVLALSLQAACTRVSVQVAAPSAGDLRGALWVEVPGAQRSPQPQESPP